MNIDPSFNIDNLLRSLHFHSAVLLYMPSHIMDRREMHLPLFYENEFVNPHMFVDKRQLSGRDGDAPRSSFP